jgi:hypothetical protein
MSEQTFRSPGFFEREIDLSARQVSVSGVPAGFVGTAEQGPAFVPITVGSLLDFQNKFGALHPERYAPYALNEFLKYQTAATYVRLLGAGSNETESDMTATEIYGVVKNSGFVVKPSDSLDPGTGIKLPKGNVRFIVANHEAKDEETSVFPQFSLNDSFSDVSDMELVRGMVLLASGTSLWLGTNETDALYSQASSSTNGSFDLVIQDSKTKKFNVSLNPKSSNYISKVLNTDPLKFQIENYVLYADFPVEEEIASTHGKTIKVVSGLETFDYFQDGSKNYKFKFKNTGINSYTIETSVGTDATSVTVDILNFKISVHFNNVATIDAQDFIDLFNLQALNTGVELTSITNLQNVELLNLNYMNLALGQQSIPLYDDFIISVRSNTDWNTQHGRFDTRYSTPRTTSFISQPYGEIEYDLFHFETLSDGSWGNDKFKISIANLRASTDPTNPYGTFEVQVRNYEDVDTNLQILESYPECNLDPESENFIARKIGDYKVYYDFDQVNEKDRRLIVRGKYGNKSSRVRVVISEDLEMDRVPKTALPFGFRGLPVLRLTDDISDNASSNLRFAEGFKPMMPPVPFRFKVTRGTMDPMQIGPLGSPGKLERIDARQYWGVLTKRLPAINSILNPNEGSVDNGLVKSYTKFLGISKLENTFTGKQADEYSNNKFTLARIALVENFDTASGSSLAEKVASSINKSASSHMLDSVYYRNGLVNSKNYTISETYVTSAPGVNPVTYSTINRFTLASLLHGDSITFNRFTPYAKFTNVFYGGFDGFNVLDKDVVYFKEKSMMLASGGKAADEAVDNGLNPIEVNKNNSGYAFSNNSINSVLKAVDILTDTMSSNINILAVPGVREDLITQKIMEKVKDYSLALYVMDIPKYSETKSRIFDDSKEKPDVRSTAEIFEARSIDNNYVATYFPDVIISDLESGRNIRVPASVAAVGTLSFNDRDKAPWYAPAGFNRGSLDFVRNVETRLSSVDRDVLYDARINPIASFPNANFVIFGQKTLQQAKTALDRVNVRRLLLEIKRQIASVANGLLFEPNTSATRARFVSSVTPLLGAIQLQAGIEQFRVIMDDTNNTQDDVDNYRMNGRVVIVPTRAVEFVAIDFIITNSGVNFS